MAVDQNAEAAPNEDNFAAAFEMLSGLGDKEPAPNAVLTEPAPVEEPAKKEEPAPKADEKTPEQIEADAAATAAGEKTLDEQAAEAEAEAAAAEADPAAAAAAAAAPAKKEAPKPQPNANDDMLERLAKLVRENPPEEKKPAAQQAPELYSAEEQEFLNTYEKDWPDVARAESLKRRGEYNQLVTHIFTEIGKHFAPVQETVATLSQQTHLQALTAQVSDYEDVRDKVVDWVETQPDYLQVAYQHVITQGTTEQVVDLIQRWRQATGTALPVAGAAKKPSDTELPAATKQAAAALAPVSSKRTAVIQTDDPNDFDGAFAKFSDIKV